jgi:hypothetical protein
VALISCVNPEPVLVQAETVLPWSTIANELPVGKE